MPKLTAPNRRHCLISSRRHWLANHQAGRQAGRQEGRRPFDLGGLGLRKQQRERRKEGRANKIDEVPPIDRQVRGSGPVKENNAFSSSEGSDCL